jgi:hypothetical protein
MTNDTRLCITGNGQIQKHSQPHLSEFTSAHTYHVYVSTSMPDWDLQDHLSNAESHIHLHKKLHFIVISSLLSAAFKIFAKISQKPSGR